MNFGVDADLRTEKVFTSYLLCYFLEKSCRRGKSYSYFIFQILRQQKLVGIGQTTLALATCKMISKQFLDSMLTVLTIRQ